MMDFNELKIRLVDNVLYTFDPNEVLAAAETAEAIAGTDDPEKLVVNNKVIRQIEKLINKYSKILSRNAARCRSFEDLYDKLNTYTLGQEEGEFGSDFDIENYGIYGGFYTKNVKAKVSSENNILISVVFGAQVLIDQFDENSEEEDYNTYELNLHDITLTFELIPDISDEVYEFNENKEEFINKMNERM